MTETTWQKPPLKERILDLLLTLFWVALIPSYYFGFIALEMSLLPVEYFYNASWDFVLMIPVTLIIWKITFWWVCQKAPKMYPVNFLIHAYETKRTWLKPPACFYTAEFQEVFKNSWMPYFAQNPSVSHEKTGASSSNQFDLSPHPTFSCNPSSATNMAFNNIHQINNEPFQSCIGEYK